MRRWTCRSTVEIYDETVRIVAQKDPGSRPPQYLLGNRARALEFLGRYDEARAAYSTCLSKDAGTAASPVDYFCLLGIASVERELGNLPAADEYIAKTAASINPSVPEGFPARVTLHLMRAKVAMSRGLFSEARTEVDSALAHAGFDALIISACLIRGELGLDESRWVEALADARRALDLAQRAQGGVPYSSRVGQAWLLLARILKGQADATRAREAAQTAIEHLSRTVDDDHAWLKQARELAL